MSRASTTTRGARRSSAPRTTRRRRSLLLTLLQQSLQALEGPRPVRILVLLFLAHFRPGARRALGDEEDVPAEAVRPARVKGDRAPDAPFRDDDVVRGRGGGRPGGPGG